MESDDELFEPIKFHGSSHYMLNKIRKSNGKKEKYHNIKSYISNNITFRHIIRGEVKKIEGTYENYIYPIRSKQRSNTWWDCVPWAPRVW
jgi:hypothetical protein